MRKPAEPAELLAVWGMLQRVERRQRISDVVVPVMTVTAMVFLGVGGVSYVDQGLTFALGFMCGLTIWSTRHRRRHFAQLKESVELLQMHEAAFQTAVLEGEGWVCDECAARVMVDVPMCPSCNEPRWD